MTAIKEKPILFSAPMVQAILDGRKSMTRRVMTPQPDHSQYHEFKGKVIYDCEHRMWCWKDLILENLIDTWSSDCIEGRKLLASRYPSQPGNRLWVKEAWAVQHDFDHCKPSEIRPRNARLHYAATENLGGLMKRSSMFMPRWASRILLEVADVRIERLQDISETDCIKEGVGSPITRDLKRPKFMQLWDSINGKRPAYSWDANPFVWVISFRRIDHEPPQP